MRGVTRACVGLAVTLLATNSEATTSSPAPDFELRRGIYEANVDETFRALAHLEQVEGSKRAELLLAHLLMTEGAYAPLSTADDDFAQWQRLQVLLHALRDQRAIETKMGSDPLTTLLMAHVALAREDVAGALQLLTSEPPKELRAWWWTTLAIAQAKDAQDPRRILERVLSLDDAGELHAAAALRWATLTADAGGDPTERLHQIPATSLVAPRAQHMLAKLEFDRDELDAARARLEQLLQKWPSYADRRDVNLTLGAIAIEQDRFDEAWQIYQSLRAEHDRAAANLQSLRANPTSAWSIWNAPAHLEIGSAAWTEQLAGAIDAALDLRVTEPKSAQTPPWHARAADQTYTDLLRPTALQLAEERDLSQELQDAEYALARRQWELQQEEARLARKRRLNERGADALLAEQQELSAMVARLDSMVAIVDDVVAQLHAVRDQELRRIAERTRSLLERGRQNLMGAQNMQDFYVKGPMGRRAKPMPEGVPTPARLLVEDSKLVGLFERFLTTFASHVPDIINRSTAEIWEPRIRGNTPILADRAHEQLDHSLAMLDSVQAELARAATSPERELALADEAAWLSTVDSLRVAHASLRDSIAHEVLDRSALALEHAREGIDYGSAAASYELGLRESESPASARRTTAVAELREFLTKYPESVARGETRFRLADMLLVDARARFHTRMEAYLAARDRGENPVVPFVDTDEAVELYELIFAEDPGFAHRDAALFHAGMILADAVDPRGEQYLSELLTEYPDSELVQRAQVRIADLNFEAGQFASASRYYQSATQGAEPMLTAIALYKLGWCHLNSEDNVAATDAFRRLLDLYEAETVETEVDLRGEAEDDLIHALSRSGGAERFAEYFDEIGPRPYETRILRGMSQLMRGYALHDEAAETDRLFLSRYRDHAEALATAQRLIDTHSRWATEAKAQTVRLELADRFQPGSSWWEANPELHDEATEFARTSYRAVALYHHRDARKNERPAAYQQAAELYETILERWPGDGEAPRFHLLAGEARAQLEEFAPSIRHYQAAAASDTASFQQDALWQTVALTDRWYESTRPDNETVGVDSLATRLIDSGRTFAAKYPGDDRVANLRWREGNLAYAHGMYQQSIDAPLALQREHPRDDRLAKAAALRAEALVKLESYADASTAYHDAWRLTAVDQKTERDRLLKLVPHCDYLHAESVAAVDSISGEAAALFANVARRWPEFEHADRAYYRSGLGYANAKSFELAVQSWEALLREHPESSFAQDAHLQIATTWENHERPLAAADAYERYSKRYPEADDADDAWLKASDLRRAAGDVTGAEQLMTAYLERFPEDLDTAFEVREKRAQLELEALGAAPVSSLLASTRASELSAFLALAKAHPEQADPGMLAQVQFLQAEEVRGGYETLRLTQPLEASLNKKKDSLEKVLTAYGECIQRSVSPWAQAAAYRIGEAMIGFGDALLASDAPADLSGDDLMAYHEVLEEQSWEFFDRGEQAWTELLQESGDANSASEWIERTRSQLFPRIARRFLHRPEVEYPLLRAEPPAVESAR